LGGPETELSLYINPVEETQRQGTFTGDPELHKANCMFRGIVPQLGSLRDTNELMTLALETEHLTSYGPRLEPWRRPIMGELNLYVIMCC